ncbi:hypothetical protein ACFYYD_13765, partial [Streptomyces bluensis]
MIQRTMGVPVMVGLLPASGSTGGIVGALVATRAPGRSAPRAGGRAGRRVVAPGAAGGQRPG